jgi:hypothetical protein
MFASIFPKASSRFAKIGNSIIQPSRRGSAIARELLIVTSWRVGQTNYKTVFAGNETTLSLALALQNERLILDEATGGLDLE